MVENDNLVDFYKQVYVVSTGAELAVWQAEGEDWPQVRAEYAFNIDGGVADGDGENAGGGAGAISATNTVTTAREARGNSRARGRAGESRPYEA